MKHILYQLPRIYLFLCMLGSLVQAATAGPAENTAGRLQSSYSYRRYTTADGLPSILNQRIYQDRQGFIWIVGTSGVARFDGFEFKTFLTGTFANLYHLDETVTDKNTTGALRFFSNRYLYTLDVQADTLRKTHQFRHYSPTVFSSLTLPAGYAICYVHGNEEEQYFCAVRDTGVVKLMAHEDLNRFRDHDKAWYDTAQHLLYIPLVEGISVINDKGRVAFYENIHAKCFVEYRNTLWAVATDGLYRQTSGGGFEKVIPCEVDESANVMVHAGADGALLFSDYSTLYRYADGSVDKIFEANAIKDFIVDNEGSIWLTTYQGVYNLFGLNFKNHTLPDTSDNIRSLVYDRPGQRVIAGTLNGKLMEITESGSQTLSYPPNPFTSEVSFNPHGTEVDGTVYLPGPGGLLQVKGRTSRWVTFPDAMFMFQFVTPLPNGNLLTGGTTRLMEITPLGKMVRQLTMTELKQRLYSQACIDRLGRIWIGGTSGISILTGDSVQSVWSDSLASCRVMQTDVEGNIWLAVGSSLYKATDEITITPVWFFDSLVTNMRFTRSGLLAVSTLDKIYLFSRDLQSHVVYDGQNGFTGVESIRADIVEDGRGYLWLPAVECLTAFLPEQLMQNSGQLRLHLLASSASTDNIRWETMEDGERTLDYKHRNVRFHYIGLSYASAQNVRYRYRLHGFQEEWSQPVKSRDVTFNNLPPGDYVFEIYALNGNREVRSALQTYAFTIKPAFWQTTWFLVGGIAFLMLASAGVALCIQSHRNRVLMEKLETEKQLNELRIKSIRLKTIPHFNANVLAAIEYYIMNLSRDEAVRLLGIYSRFTFQTLREVDKASRSLSDELEYAKMYLELEKLRFLGKFDYCFEIDPSVDMQVQLPNMILHTYCENAVKHGFATVKAGGILVVKAVGMEGTVRVSVSDNGVGREAAAGNRHVPGARQGLEILSRQIEIYNRFNKIKIIQQVDDLWIDGHSAGTCFQVEVPLGFVYQ